MYLCDQCGNKHKFIEVNRIKTYVELNSKGVVKSTDDIFVDCESVECDVCGKVIREYNN